MGADAARSIAVLDRSANTFNDRRLTAPKSSLQIFRLVFPAPVHLSLLSRGRLPFTCRKWALLDRSGPASEEPAGRVAWLDETSSTEAPYD